MIPEIYYLIKDHYDQLEEQLADLVSGMPVRAGDPDFEPLLDWTLSAFKASLRVMMQTVAEQEDFEQALAIQRFMKDRLGKYP
jgi:hypothetical protein